MGGRPTSLLTFGVKGGLAAAKRFYDSLELVKRLVNIGDAKSLACHPASTTHRQMSPQELEKAGVTVEMIRLSIGIEHVEDIIDDLDRALGRGDRAFLQDPFHTNSARRGLALRFKPRLEAASPLYDAPLRAARAATPRPQRKPTEIAFVNNMPDLAASATQAQFLRLVRSASGDAPFNFRCYLSPLVARSEGMKRQLHQTHEDLDVLYLRGADALIVTGAEPRATLLTDEPFWPDLARLVDWARDHTVASLWSCLAAHAAVQRLDGIMRRRASEKFSGVYAFERNPEDCLMRGAGPRILTPLSLQRARPH